MAHPRIRHALAIVAGLALTGVAAAEAPQPPTTQASTKHEGPRLPTSLHAARRQAEDVYERARAGDWKAATAGVEALEALSRSARVEAAGHALVTDRLDADVVRLDHAVAWKDRRAAMEAANDVTVLVTELSSIYRADVPVELGRLDVLGRDLELAVLRDDPRILKSTTRLVRETWDAVRVRAEGRFPAEAARLEDLLERLEAADTVAAGSRLTRPLGQAVDSLEALFG